MQGGGMHDRRYDAIADYQAFARILPALSECTTPDDGIDAKMGWIFKERW